MRRYLGFKCLYIWVWFSFVLVYHSFLFLNFLRNVIVFFQYMFSSRCCDVTCPKVETWGNREKERGGRRWQKGKEKVGKGKEKGPHKVNMYLRECKYNNYKWIFEWLEPFTWFNMSWIKGHLLSFSLLKKKRNVCVKMQMKCLYPYKRKGTGFILGLLGFFFF